MWSVHSAPDAAYEPFGVAVRPRGAGRDLHHPHPRIGQHGIEPGGELRVPVPDEEPERAGPLVQVHDEVAGLLGGPRAGRVRGHPEDVHPAGGDLHDEQHVDPAQRHRVEVEEVTGQQSAGLGTQELAPTGVGTPRRRANPSCGQDTADRAGPDPVPQSDQFTLDTVVPPARIRRSQPQDQLPNLHADRWAPGPVRIRPVPGDQAAVPGQQRRGGDQPTPAQPARQDPTQRAQHRPVRPRQPRCADLAAQHRHLVAQREQLRGVDGVGTGQQHQPAEHPDQAQIQQPHRHPMIVTQTRVTPAHRQCDEFWHGTGHVQR